MNEGSVSILLAMSSSFGSVYVVIVNSIVECRIDSCATRCETPDVVNMVANVCSIARAVQVEHCLSGLTPYLSNSFSPAESSSFFILPSFELRIDSGSNCIHAGATDINVAANCAP